MEATQAPQLSRPIFVVAPPRAGARLLGAVFGALPGTWSPLGGHGVLGSPVVVGPSQGPQLGRGGRLTAADCTSEVRQRLLAGLLAAAGQCGADGRLYDASPHNALRVSFLAAAFPDATFVYVHRRAADALRESLVLWQAGSAVTHPDLPGWSGPPWSFLLVPGWEELSGRPLAEVVCEQWVRTMRVLLADLEELPAQSWCAVEHDALLGDPRRELSRLFSFLGLRASGGELGTLAHAARSGPPEAALRTADTELRPLLARTEHLLEQAGDWLAR